MPPRGTGPSLGRVGVGYLLTARAPGCLPGGLKRVAAGRTP